MASDKFPLPCKWRRNKKHIWMATGQRQKYLATVCLSPKRTTIQTTGWVDWMSSKLQLTESLLNVFKTQLFCLQFFAVESDYIFLGVFVTWYSTPDSRVLSCDQSTNNQHYQSTVFDCEVNLLSCFEIFDCWWSDPGFLCLYVGLSWDTTVRNSLETIKFKKKICSIFLQLQLQISRHWMIKLSAG